MVGDQLVIVSGEEDILVSYPTTIPYVEAVKESFETTFQALEIVDNAYVETSPIQPSFSDTCLMVA